jgi:ATP/maltotriose-dependent transcriptional regulator MalT
MEDRLGGQEAGERDYLAERENDHAQNGEFGDDDRSSLRDSGESSADRAVRVFVRDGYLQRPAPDYPVRDIADLTDREREEVLRLVGLCHSNQEICTTLCISMATTKPISDACSIAARNTSAVRSAASCGSATERATNLVTSSTCAR